MSELKKNTETTTNNKATNRMKFEKLAKKRVANALKAIELIGKLSNTSNYSYDESHIKDIKKALNDEINDTISQFTKKLRSKKEFDFNRK
tara:strand:- start:213 stop:482 length:270 start_codon:yes stop_codon:yes gene_type:complete